MKFWNLVKNFFAPFVAFVEEAPHLPQDENRRSVDDGASRKSVARPSCASGGHCECNQEPLPTPLHPPHAVAYPLPLDFISAKDVAKEDQLEAEIQAKQATIIDALIAEVFGPKPGPFSGPVPIVLPKEELTGSNGGPVQAGQMVYFCELSPLSLRVQQLMDEAVADVRENERGRKEGAKL